MSACCKHCAPPPPPPKNSPYRRVLWIALAVNALMFAVEIVTGIGADSASLLADALDFLGDAANYAISLWVLGLGLAPRARAAQLKAWSMGAFGIGVLASVAWHTATGSLPEAPTMGAVGALALAANLAVAGLLYAWRDGDSNMRSVWLCSRNDALGNVAVMLAALGVFGTGQPWPDLIVALLMAGLALSGAWQILSQAGHELTAASAAGAPARTR
jgi:Co/Zn/Cd efflux system component